MQRASFRILPKTNCRFFTTPVNVDKSNVRVGWIGTGIMGKSMLKNLITAGFSKFFVYNRTLTKAAGIVKEVQILNPQAKIELSQTPREVAANSDIIFSIVGLPADGMLEEIIINDIFLIKKK